MTAGARRFPLAHGENAAPRAPPSARRPSARRHLRLPGLPLRGPRRSRESLGPTAVPRGAWACAAHDLGHRPARNPRPDWAPPAPCTCPHAKAQSRGQRGGRVLREPGPRPPPGRLPNSRPGGRCPLQAPLPGSSPRPAARGASPGAQCGRSWHTCPAVPPHSGSHTAASAPPPGAASPTPWSLRHSAGTWCWACGVLGTGL